MLSEIARPEKNVTVHTLDETQELLETHFKVDRFQTTLEHIHLRPDGHIECEGRILECGQFFLESLAQSIGMSLGYAYDIDFELLRDNFERRKKAKCTALTICVSHDTAVGLAPEQYRPARTVDVLREAARQTRWELREARINDRGIDINLIEPGRKAAVEPGDDIELGIRLSNSETGYAGCKALFFALRMVCTNGAVMSEHRGSARWNYDQRVNYATSIQKFGKDVLKLAGRQESQTQLYSPALNRILLDNQLDNLWRRLRTSLPATSVDTVLGLSLEERQTIHSAVRHRAFGLPPQPTSHRLWDVHNRITAAAQRLDFARRSRLERIGGLMLEHTDDN
jgi:hypothetical protein